MTVRPHRTPVAGPVAALTAVAVGLILIGRSPDPSEVPIADRCVAEPGAQLQDLDTDDSPETPWGHIPGQEVSVHFATADLPARYAGLVEEAAALWSRSPCVEALAVAECPDGTNCTIVLAEARDVGSGEDTDGESEGVDRAGVRLANTIRLRPDVLDGESDNGALATVVHEMGHALGLMHRDDPDSVMNAVTDDDTDPRPDAIDFANLVVLYGATTG
jgi:rhodanese-related sulfurtransferase